MDEFRVRRAAALARLVGALLPALVGCGDQGPQPGQPAPAAEPRHEVVEASAADRSAELEEPVDAVGLSAAEPEEAPEGSQGTPRARAAERAAQGNPSRPGAARRKAREGSSKPTRRLPAGVTLVGDDTHDFGTVPQGTRLRHEFALLSSGAGELVLQAVKTTCECATQGQVLRETADGARVQVAQGESLQPGESFVLVVESETAAARGPFHSNVVLYTNAPEPVHVELRAVVQPVLDLVPPTLALGRITTAEGAEATARVRSTDGRAFRLELARSTVEHFGADLVPIEPDAAGRAREWRVDVHLSPSALVGSRTYRLNLVSDLATGAASGTALVDYHAVELVAEVQVTEVFRAQPEFISFGRVSSGEVASVRVELECLASAGFPAQATIRLEPVPGQPLPPQGSVAFELHRREDGRTAELEARLLGLPEGSSGSYGAIVVVAGGVAELPELRLRVYVSCD